MFYTSWLIYTYNTSCAVVIVVVVVIEARRDILQHGCKGRVIFTRKYDTYDIIQYYYICMRLKTIDFFFQTIECLS